jgi:dTDP-4-amino-4,6-dideoxygalactose transaminase
VPNKNLGDGGMVTNKDADLAFRIRRRRQYGWDDAPNAHETGVNSRLDPLEAGSLAPSCRFLTPTTCTAPQSLVVTMRRSRTIASANKILLSLPIYPELSGAKVDRVTAFIDAFYQRFHRT